MTISREHQHDLAQHQRDRTIDRIWALNIIMALVAVIVGAL